MSLKDHSVVKAARAVFEQTGDSCAHIFAIKEWRRHFIDDLIRRARASVEIRTHHALASGKGQGWALSKPFGESPCL